MSSPAATLTVERRAPSRPADLDSLRAALAEHLEAKPVMPSPYDPRSRAGWDYFDARCAWSDKRRRLEHEIWKLQHPKLTFARVDRPGIVYRQAAPRLRR